MSSFLHRLRERKLFQWALAYLAGAWLVLQLVDVLGQIFQWSLALQQGITIFLGVGFFVALLVAWYHGEQGRQRVSGPELLMIAVLLAVGAAVVSLLGPGGREVTRAEDEAPTFAVADDRPSIAALPWTNRSGREEDLYFTDGIHDEILTRLSKFSGLRVISRQSVMRFRDSPLDMGEIAEALRVRYVLEAGLLRAQDKVRINVQLIDAHTDDHLWAETYDRPLSIENLLDIQSEIASQIATELKAVLTPEERERVAARPTDNLEAYEHYLRGRMFSREHTAEDWQRAMQSFERAIALDSTFAHAYVGLAWSHRELARVFSSTAGEGYEKATDASTKAIEIDENIGEAYALLGSIKFVADWDMSGPEPYFRRALELSPGSTDVYQLYAQYLTWMERDEEAIEMATRAVELDPLTPMMNAWLAITYFYANRYDESIAWLRKALELDPGFVWAHIYLAHNYNMKGDSASAIVHADRVDAVSRSTGNPTLVAYVGWDYGRAGAREKAETVLAETLDLHMQGSIGAMAVANIYVGLGENDAAFEWMRRAVEERGGTVVYLKSAYGRTLHSDLRPDPRYDELLRLVGFED
jgi:TolB-like protein/Tfp pilus assembly protein PilF